MLIGMRTVATPAKDDRLPGGFLPSGFLPSTEDDPFFHKTMEILRELRELGVLHRPAYKIRSPYERSFRLLHN